MLAFDAHYLGYTVMHNDLMIVHLAVIKGNCTPKQKLVWFVLYLKIVNTFLKNNICILE